MATKRFNLKQAPEPDKLDQLFFFTGKLRGADVLLRLVEACGYEVVAEALEKLKPTQPKQRKPARSKALPTEPATQPPARDK